MKKYRMMLFMLLSATEIIAQQTKKEYYDYSKTKIKAEYQVNSAGEKSGWFKGYDQKGVLVTEYNFLNGKQHGTCKEYSTYNGRQLSKLETYKSGILNGPHKLYGGTDGKLAISEGEYLDGEKQGKWVVYQGYSNYDIPKAEQDANAYYKTEQYYENGKPIYPDGTVKWYFYPSGKLYASLTYSDGNQSGVQTWYFPNGKLSNEEKFENGVLIYSKTYWPNGQLRTHNSDQGYEGYNQDGTQDREMENNAKMAEQAKRKRAFNETMSKADSLLLGGSYDQALQLYTSIGVQTYLITSFTKLYQEYKADNKSAWWLEQEFSTIQSRADGYAPNRPLAHDQYCRNVIAAEKSKAEKR